MNHGRRPTLCHEFLDQVHTLCRHDIGIHGIKLCETRYHAALVEASQNKLNRSFAESKMDVECAWHRASCGVCEEYIHGDTVGSNQISSLQT